MNAEEYSKKLEAQAKRPAKKKKTILYAALTIIAVLLLIHYTPKLVYAMHHETTDNAFVKGDMVPVSPQVKGRISKVNIEDNMQVKKGDILFEIESSDYAIALAKSREELAAAQAQIAAIDASAAQARENINQAQALRNKAQSERNFADKEQQRYARLVSENLVSKNSYDSVNAKADETAAQSAAADASVKIALANLATIEANRKAAEFKAASAQQAVNAAELDLERTIIRAPRDGRIGQNNVKVGRFVQPGQTVISLVGSEKLWIEANFKETQLNHIRVGQKVEIKADAYPDMKIDGHVDSIQPGTGSAFSLLPAENATGNFVKVVQRVPVKILIDGDAGLLVPGLSVEPSVKIK